MGGAEGGKRSVSGEVLHFELKVVMGGISSEGGLAVKLLIVGRCIGDNIVLKI